MNIKEVVKNHALSFVDTPTDKLLFVITCAVFGTAFMVIYDPLTIKSIIVYPRLGQLITVKAAAVVGALTIAFNQFVIRKIFGIKTFKLSSFILWGCFEIFTITLVIYFVYREYKTLTLAEYLVVVKYAGGISAPPYVFACILLQLKQLWLKTGQDEVDSNVEASDEQNVDDYLTITNSNGKEQLIVRSDKILYAESKSNYIEFSIIDGENIKHKRVRNTLKNLEHGSLSDAMIRVHRSFMVNKALLSHIDRKGAKWTIKLAHPHCPEIPISTSYQDSLSHIA